MSNENVNIQVNEDNYIAKYLQVRTWNLLSKTEYKALAEIIKTGTIRTEDRKRIREKLKMSTQSFNNLLGKLDRKRLLTHDEVNRTYSPNIKVPKELGSVTFNFVKQ